MASSRYSLGGNVWLRRPLVLSEKGIRQEACVLVLLFLVLAHSCTYRSARYLKSLASLPNGQSDRGTSWLFPTCRLAPALDHPAIQTDVSQQWVVYDCQALPVESRHTKKRLYHSSPGRRGLTTVIAEPSPPIYLRWLATCSVHAHNFPMACIKPWFSSDCFFDLVLYSRNHKASLEKLVSAVHLQTLARSRRFSSKQKLVRLQYGPACRPAVDE